VIGHDQRYQDASSEISSGLFGLHGLSGTPNSRGVPAVFTIGLFKF
jgi:hypothetical protein